EGFEADDVIGTLARIAEERGHSVTIVSGDLDCLQLVTESVEALVPRRGITDTFLYGPDQVRQRYGFEPPQLIDFKALRGDTSDNIPGVPGVGDKTAAGPGACPTEPGPPAGASSSRADDRPGSRRGREPGGRLRRRRGLRVHRRHRSRLSHPRPRRLDGGQDLLRHRAGGDGRGGKHAVGAADLRTRRERNRAGAALARRREACL